MSAGSAEQVSLLIGDIYDAALDPALWPPVLEKVTRFIGGPASALVSHNTVSGTGRFYYSWGDDPHYTRLYLEKYVKLNPATPHLMLAGTGKRRGRRGGHAAAAYRRYRPAARTLRAVLDPGAAVALKE